MIRAIIITGTVIFLLLIINQLISFSFIRYDLPAAGYAAYLAVFAIAIGLALGRVTAQKRKMAGTKYAIDASAMSALEEELSPRELEILVKLAEGKSNAEIADELFISRNTVKTHINNIYRKLGVNRRTQAVLRARELTLLA